LLQIDVARRAREQLNEGFSAAHSAAPTPTPAQTGRAFQMPSETLAK